MQVVLFGEARRVAGVLVAVGDVTLGIDVALRIVVEAGIEVGRAVVGAAVGATVDNVSAGADVVGCVGKGPSSTTAGTVTVEGPGAPAVEAPHAVVARIATTAQHTRRPLMVETLSHAGANDLWRIAKTVDMLRDSA